MIYVSSCVPTNEVCPWFTEFRKHYSNISGFPEYRCFIPHFAFAPIFLSLSLPLRIFLYWRFFLVRLFFLSSSSSWKPQTPPSLFICVLIHRCVTLDSEANISEASIAFYDARKCLFTHFVGARSLFFFPATSPRTANRIPCAPLFFRETFCGNIELNFCDSIEKKSASIEHYHHQGHPYFTFILQLHFSISYMRVKLRTKKDTNARKARPYIVCKRA